MTDRISEAEGYAIERTEAAHDDVEEPGLGLLAIAAWLSAIHEELKRGNGLRAGKTTGDCAEDLISMQETYRT